MSDEQLTRFEFFVRSHFSRSSIRSILAKSLQGDLTKNDIPEELGIVVGGLAKLYVGELIETGICNIIVSMNLFIFACSFQQQIY
jgi:hypothetical protein